jgi:carboxymethylenebutenolidase
MTTPFSIHKPTTDATQAVIVLQEAFGVNEHIEDVCARLANEGYLAVAPHLFHRTGDPMLGYEDMSLVREHMAALTQDEIRADLARALQSVDEAGVAPSQTGIAGFCMGGSIAVAAAAEYDLGAAVTFYGGGIVEPRFGFPPLAETAERMRTPWLGLFGDQDPSIPVDEVELLREAASRAAAPTRIVRYREAGHGFNCDRRDSYHEASAQSAWSEMTAWFAAHLGHR